MKRTTLFLARQSGTVWVCDLGTCPGFSQRKQHKMCAAPRWTEPEPLGGNRALKLRVTNARKSKCPTQTHQKSASKTDTINGFGFGFFVVHGQIWMCFIWIFTLTERKRWSMVMRLNSSTPRGIAAMENVLLLWFWCVLSLLFRYPWQPGYVLSGVRVCTSPLTRLSLKWLTPILHPVSQRRTKIEDPPLMPIKALPSVSSSSPSVWLVESF